MCHVTTVTFPSLPWWGPWDAGREVTKVTMVTHVYPLVLLSGPSCP